MCLTTERRTPDILDELAEPSVVPVVEIVASTYPPVKNALVAAKQAVCKFVVPGWKALAKLRVVGRRRRCFFGVYLRISPQEGFTSSSAVCHTGPVPID